MQRQNTFMTDQKPQAVFRPKTTGPLYILAPFVPTPYEVVARMLTLAGVTSEDVVYDLGCGDERIIISAAVQCGARGVGVDIEPYRVEESQANARDAGVEHLVTFSKGDALDLDLSQATVIALYLVHWSTAKVQSLIVNSVRPGTRVVSHNFGLQGTSVKSEVFLDATGATHNLHLWIAD